MGRVVIAGCGVIGAAIAYELSWVPELQITVCDRGHPAHGSTGAALGVLMAVISKKVKGRNLAMRLAGIQQYDQWIPELERLTGKTIPYNRQGILLLSVEPDRPLWERLVQVRQQQGYPLELLEPEQLRRTYPQLNLERVTLGIHSPADRQLDPTALTLALVEAAQQRGVRFLFETPVLGTESGLTDQGQRCQVVQTSADRLPTDWFVIAAGIGSTPLTNQLQQPFDIRPVLGQAAEVKLAQPLGNSDSHPMITSDDIHLVPLGQSRYWVGATVEFPPEAILAEPARFSPDPAQWQLVMQRAIDLCPPLAEAEIIRTWYGLRPRPEGMPAPVIQPLSGYTNVLLATGHYRNGVLLAPATAVAIREAIQPP